MESSKYCSACKSFRAVNEFRQNVEGQLLKTCSRHSRKRKQPSLDSWDEFLFEIREWNRPSQTNRLSIDYIFDVDQLPVTLGPQPEKLENGSYDKTNLNEGINHLVAIIWRESGFRFRQQYNNKSLKYNFFCAQDKSRFDRSLSSSSHKTRDRSQMERFPCNSKLSLLPSFEDRTLSLSLCHDFHIPYTDIHLSEEIKKFVEKHGYSQSPSEIYQSIQGLKVLGYESATQSQIYYLWHKISMKYWKRCEDQFDSTKLFLMEKSEDFRQLEFYVDNFRGLGIYINASIKILANQTKELVIDATYGTNSAGCDLFAVLAEFDGTGVPLAYLFVEKSILTGTTSSVVPGKLTQILVQFLRPLLDLGFNPSFFGSDKDRSEINAVKQVWPTTNIQLCFWHAKRAIQSKLKDCNKADSLVNYFPGEARLLVPNLEICWGSYSKNRPSQEHRTGECLCESRSLVFEGNGRLEISSDVDRNLVLAIFSRHFNAHSLIPDCNGTLKSPQAIHHECANEMYTWCRARDYHRLWAYLYVNWYRYDQWNIWARSTCPEEIPVLRTTMIVESHWRRIKRDFLYRFNRPRIDLVVWILVSRSIPQGLDKMEAIRSGNYRKAVASWRKKFRQQWKKHQTQGADSESLRKYHTNPSAWTCGCTEFLLSRFLICKHIIKCFEKIEDPNRFFNTVRRRRSSPFWAHPQLILRPEFQPQIKCQTYSEDSDSEPSSEFGVDESEEFEDQLVEMDDEATPTYDATVFASKMRRLVDFFVEQHSIGNTKFAERLIRQNASNMTLLDEIDQRNRRQTRAPTWVHYKNSITMYYQPL